MNSNFLEFLLNQNEIAFEDIQNSVVSKYCNKKYFEEYLPIISVNKSNVTDLDLIRTFNLLRNESTSFKTCFGYYCSYLAIRTDRKLQNVISQLLIFKEFFKEE